MTDWSGSAVDVAVLELTEHALLDVDGEPTFAFAVRPSPSSRRLVVLGVDELRLHQDV